MSTYAVGDIHGCHLTFLALLDRFDFSPSRDRLWLVGDLVNRGPSSLEVLRWVRDHDDCVTAVLGNHDLHLLARAAGVRPERPLDSLDEILAAPDREELLSWLRHRPLMVREGERVLVHAGLHPAWSVDQALAIAEKLATSLRSDDHGALLAGYYAPHSKCWFPNLGALEAEHAALRALTSIRRIARTGQHCPDPEQDDEPEDCLPWYEYRARDGLTVVYGHWARLGHHRAPGYVALDSGCVWGGQLTGIRLDDDELFQEPLADRSAVDRG